MKRAWLSVVAACGANSAAPIAPPPPSVDAAVPMAVAKMTADGASHPRIEARPGGAITQLSAVAEGDAALTRDGAGAILLWPTLDGTREPCLVDLADVHANAIARHGKNFFIAYLNAANDLELVEIDDQGRRLRHRRISHEATFNGLAMTSLGVLAWSADQIVELYDFDGALIGHLGTQPGQRLLHIVANGAHVLTELELDPEHAIVRELVLQPQLAWAPPIDTDGEPRGAIAISPSGKVVAVTVTDGKSATVRAFEVASGQTLARIEITNPIEVGFGDDSHLAIAKGTGVAWFSLQPAFKRETVAGSAVAAADLDNISIVAGAMIRGVGSSVLIARPQRETYLGYGITAPTIAVLSPAGIVIAGRGQTALLNDQLVEIPGAPKLQQGSVLADLAWLGGTQFVATLDDGLQVVSSDRDAVVLPLVAAPADTNRRHVSSDLPHSSQLVRYLPATQILTVSFGALPRVEHWDLAQRALTRLATLPRTPLGEDRQLVPIDPALAGGAELVDVRMAQKVTVAWTDATTTKTFATAEVMAFLGADEAGHVYAYVVNAQRIVDLAVLTRGVVTSVLPRPKLQFTVWPDPKGSGAIELAKDRATLVRLDGTVAWEHPLVGGVRALWSSGSIVIATTSGVLRLDAKTGAVIGARCGWRFGLSETVQPPAPEIEPTCSEQRADGGS